MRMNGERADENEKYIKPFSLSHGERERESWLDDDDDDDERKKGDNSR